LYSVNVCVEDSLKDVGLDKFLARNTSEDNVSFADIMAEAEKKRRLKHAWLYEKVDEQLEVSCHVQLFEVVLFKMLQLILECSVTRRSTQ